MSFGQFYSRFRYSIEVFPPKTDEGVKNVFKELAALKVIDPAFISVTYGAFGSTRDLTKDLALRIKRELNLEAAFHFTCVGSGRSAIRQYVTELRDNGINLVVALRGDKPPGMETFVPPPDGFSYASELVAYLQEIGGFSLAVAGYPEKHIEAPSLEVDINNLKRKVDAGADIIITQIFYDNADYYRYVEKVRASGVAIPVIAGIMPIMNLKQIQRITGLCGAKLPSQLLARLEACGDDEAAMREVGIDHAAAQCRDLIAHGAPGIHFYALNKAHSVLQVVARL